MKKTGDAYLDSEDFRRMLARYEEAVSTGQPVYFDAGELAEIADYYQMVGEKEKADSAIEMALSLAPGAIAPLTYKIHESLFDNKIELAEHYLSMIVETDEPDYLYDRVEILLAKERDDEAAQLLAEEFERLEPAERQDFIVDVAGIYQDYNLSEEAMKWLQKGEDEDTAVYKELLGRVLFGLGRFQECEQLFNELIDRNPFSKHYWNLLASAQFMQRDYANALQSSEYALAIDPSDSDALMAKANGLYQLENYEQAHEYYQRYIQINPADELALYHLGNCLVNLDRTKEAVTTLERALSVAATGSPYLPDIYQELAFCYNDQGDTDKAIDFLNKTDQLNCNHSEIEVSKGHILLSAERQSEAEQHFRAAVLQSNDPQHTMLRIIISVLDNKYQKAAYEMFRNYFKTFQDNTNDGYAYMALCCYNLKLTDEFLTYLDKACQRNPTETKFVLGFLFPEKMEPAEYYNYMKEQLKK